MKRFILKVSLFIIALFIPLIIWILLYGFPPPNLSNNLSFNAKCQFVKEYYCSDSLNILAIGSSMTLNNIYTKSIVNTFGEKYLNFSSWGQNIEEDYRLMKILAKHLDPKVIIVSCNYMDFNSNSKYIKYDELEQYLFDGKMGFLMFGRGKVFLQNAKRFHKYKFQENTYQNLNFDKNGGVNFSPINFQITSARWNGNSISKFSVDFSQYYYLDSIARFCNEENIHFVCVQSPFRDGWISQISENDKIILDKHITKLDSLVSANNCEFINTLEEVWADSLFVDYSHMNNLGSKKYTDLLISRMDSLRRN